MMLGGFWCDLKFDDEVRTDAFHGFKINRSVHCFDILFNDPQAKAGARNILGLRRLDAVKS